MDFIVVRQSDNLRLGAEFFYNTDGFVGHRGHRGFRGWLLRHVHGLHAVSFCCANAAEAKVWRPESGW